jgi:hypothetical protein
VTVVFGSGKFRNHSVELASFRSYDLAAPEVFAVVIGLIDLLGGAIAARASPQAS